MLPQDEEAGILIRYIHYGFHLRYFLFFLFKNSNLSNYLAFALKKNNNSKKLNRLNFSSWRSLLPSTSGNSGNVARNSAQTTACFELIVMNFIFCLHQYLTLDILPTLTRLFPRIQKGFLI